MKRDSSWWALEIERIQFNRRAAWEGKEEHCIELGNALLKIEAGFGSVIRLRLPDVEREKCLDRLIEHVEGSVHSSGWFIGPGIQPADLEQLLLKRGFVPLFEWDGLLLEDLGGEMATNPDVEIEPLSWDNADEYATHCTEVTDPQFHAYLFASAQRFCAQPHREVEIFVARLHGHVAGYAVLRLEPNGVAYLGDAMTVPTFRKRGVYSSLVAHRLKVARAGGCLAAVTLAQRSTSAPILVRHGFTVVSRMIALTRKRAPSPAQM